MDGIIRGGGLFRNQRCVGGVNLGAAADVSLVVQHVLIFGGDQRDVTDSGNAVHVHRGQNRLVAQRRPRQAVVAGREGDTEARVLVGHQPRFARVDHFRHEKAVDDARVHRKHGVWLFLPGKAVGAGG